MRNNLVLITLLLIPILTQGQTYYNRNIDSTMEFQKAIGGDLDDEGAHIIAVSNNEYINIGYTESFGAGKSDVYMMKLDKHGNIKWSKTYGGKSNDYGRYICEDKDKNLLIVGYTSDLKKGNNQVLVIKTTPDGEQIWTKTYFTEKSCYGSSIELTKDGGFAIVGETNNVSNAESNSEILVIKCNKEGIVEWSNIYGDNKSDFGYSIEQTKDGGFIVGGETNSIGKGEFDFYVLKLNSRGDLEWAKSYGGPKSDYGRVVRESPDGGYVIGGSTENYHDTELDICLIKIDQEGNISWARTYGGVYTEYLLNLIYASDGNIVTTGYSNSFDNHNDDAVLFVLGPDGRMKWGKSYGGLLGDQGISVCVTPNNGVLITGNSSSFESKKEDVMIIRTTYDYSLFLCNSGFLRPSVSKVVPSVSHGGKQSKLKVESNTLLLPSAKVESKGKSLCIPAPVYK